MVLTTLLPPPVRRAIRGLLGPRVVLTDELPPERSPGALALVQRRDDLSPLTDTLTIFSYNVKRCENRGRVAASLARAVDDHHPDVILLQEVPRELIRGRGPGGVCEGRSLFFAPFHQVDRPDRRYPYRQYGQLTASGRHIENEAVIELPTVNPATLGPGHLMKRIALYAELPTTDGRTIGLVNVHNEPFARRRDRLLQYEALLRVIDERRPDAAVCCGDFNPTLGQRAEPGLRLLEDSGFSNALAGRWRALDTCLARGHRGFVRVQTLPFGGSDHRPLVVEVIL
jgi:endonuclease/exonuclease/phosphatase family metal-dependent hydrolase